MAVFLQNVIVRGTIASRPASASISIGAIFIASDTGLMYRNNGTTWDRFGTATYSQSWSAQTSVTVAHNLGTTAVLVQCFTGGSPDIMIAPETVRIFDANNVILTFSGATDGHVTVAG